MSESREIVSFLSLYQVVTNKNYKTKITKKKWISKTLVSVRMAR